MSPTIAGIKYQRCWQTMCTCCLDAWWNQQHHHCFQEWLISENGFMNILSFSWFHPGPPYNNSWLFAHCFPTFAPVWNNSIIKPSTKCVASCGAHPKGMGIDYGARFAAPQTADVAQFRRKYHSILGALDYLSQSRLYHCWNIIGTADD